MRLWAFGVRALGMVAIMQRDSQIIQESLESQSCRINGSVYGYWVGSRYETGLYGLGRLEHGQNNIIFDISMNVTGTTYIPVRYSKLPESHIHSTGPRYWAAILVTRLLQNALAR
jgi:hypothetical protein